MKLFYSAVQVSRYLFIQVLTIVFLSTILTSCKKFVQVSPPLTGSVSETVFKQDASATAVLTGIYTDMSNADLLSDVDSRLANVTVFGGLYADELKPSGTSFFLSRLYTNSLTPVESTPEYWIYFYNTIYTANAAIEGLTAATSLTPVVKQQLLGEAYFIRGLCYFYLVNLFGDVPLSLSVDYKKNATFGRASTVDVYTQLTNDLLLAEDHLALEYRGGDARSEVVERVRPNKAAAQALLARAYLFQLDYEKAETYSDKVIDNPVYDLPALNEVFLKNSIEAIWQVPSVRFSNSVNTPEGRVFLLSESPLAGPAVDLTNTVLDCFESGDQRKVEWIQSGTSINGTNVQFPYKYRLGSGVPAGEYSVVLRLAELYFIRAEARAMQNNIDGAQDDLNAIRNRAGLPNTTATNQQDLITALVHERQAELFTEWGHRFFDLKRLRLLDTVLGGSKPQYWKSHCQLFPIPQNERNLNPALSQNPGYN